MLSLDKFEKVSAGHYILKIQKIDEKYAHIVQILRNLWVVYEKYDMDTFDVDDMMKTNTSLKQFKNKQEALQFVTEQYFI